MNKKLSILLLSSFLILGACSKEETKKTTTENATEQKKANDKGEKNNAPVEKKSEAELASELVLKDTKLVKIFSINQRMNENYKELGPFYFIRGVDEKGRKTEVWVNKGKIYEIN